MILRNVYLKEIFFWTGFTLEEEVTARIKTQISYTEVGGIFCCSVYFRNTLGRRLLGFPSTPDKKKKEKKTGFF